jgi:hypothetical protein
MWASDSNHLPARCFVRTPNRWKSMGPILPTGLTTVHGATTERLWTILPKDLGPLKKNLVGKRFAADVDVKRAVACWLQTQHRFLLRRNTSRTVTVRQMYKSISMWRSDVYHLLTMRHVFIEVEIKVRALLCCLELPYVWTDQSALRRTCSVHTALLIIYRRNSG